MHERATTWAAGESGDGTPAIVRIDGDRAMAVELGDGVCRVRVYERSPGLGWVRVHDTTLEAVCRVEALHEGGDLGDEIALLAGFGPSSFPLEAA